MATAPTEGTRTHPGAWTAEDAGDCPRCGTPYAPLQEYCLECGLRLPEDALPQPASRVGRVLPGSDDWMWPVLVAFVVALLAVTAVVASRLMGGGAEEPLVATTEIPEFVPSVTPPPALAPTVPTLPPAATTSPARTTRPTASGELTTWPARRPGWTIVLASDATRAAATARARRARRDGFEEVGVLESSRYGSLHPGYFVVFSGIYPSRNEAEDALAEVQDRGYERAYVREIVP